MAKTEKTKSKKVTEICLIAPTENLAKKTRKILNDINEDINVYVPVVNDALNDAIRISKDLVNQGAKIIISRKGTMAAIKRELDIPIVGINRILSDYIESIEIAKNIKGLVAFFYYEDITEDVKTMCHMLDINIKYYQFRTDRDCEVVVKKAIEDGAVFGIGGVMTQKYSEIYNLRHVTIENSEESIINSIETAKQILYVQKEELKKQNELNLQLERYKAVLNFTHDAIIDVDEKGKIDVAPGASGNTSTEDLVYMLNEMGYETGIEFDRILQAAKYEKSIITGNFSGHNINIEKEQCNI